MKRFLVLLFLTPLIVACSPPADEAPEAPQVEEAAVPEAPQVETAAASDAPEPAAYYEFLWCKFGENYSPESRDAYFADFNTIADSISSTTNLDNLSISSGGPSKSNSS